MTLFHSHSHDEKLRCPYKGCEKTFEKPTVLTDTTTIPRQTYYACPYCMSKLDIITENMKIIGVKPTEYPKVFESPAKCAHFSALLNARPENAPLPEECLLCPKVLQCKIRK
jgi:DNA-directed RNA polymerase subunit RPC12/RpoP